MSKDGLCAIVTGSASGLGPRPRPSWPRAARASSSIIPPARRKPSRPPISAARPAPRSWWCRATSRATRIAGRSSRPPRPGAGSMRWSTMPAPPSTWRMAISTDCRRKIFSACSASTPSARSRWCARREAAGGRRQGVGARLGRGQRLVGRRHQRRRLLGRLCREQGRAQHHDAVAGARAGAADPRQHRVPRLYRHALVHQGPRRGRRQAGARHRWWRRCR
jgi:hypothetical protein